MLFVYFLVTAGLVSSVSAEDRIQLDGTSIKGSRELPKVLYIVPWKSARLGALSVSAGSKSFDTEMEALDRDVFRRQVQYYGMLYGIGTKEK
ncbi:MAG: hypothetical protein KAU29_10995 [Gammaproteobacteria bacterium]|nr:hypothetical protein [Gammaproteobacteria bacterium]